MPDSATPDIRVQRGTTPGWVSVFVTVPDDDSHFLGYFTYSPESASPCIHDRAGVTAVYPNWRAAAGRLVRRTWPGDLTDRIAAALDEALTPATLADIRLEQDHSPCAKVAAVVLATLDDDPATAIAAIRAAAAKAFGTRDSRTRTA